VEERAAAVEPPLARLCAGEELAELRAALARLGERQRALLVMRCVEERSCGEIGAALGMTANAVSIAIYRAKSELREMLSRGEEAGR
jgi:RNA polymerase sigma factor for flagellar operon FliA